MGNHESYEQFVINCIEDVGKLAEASIALGGRDLVADELDIDDIVKLQRDTKIEFSRILSQRMLKDRPDDAMTQSFAKMFEDRNKPFWWDDDEDDEEDWGLFDE